MIPRWRTEMIAQGFESLLRPGLGRVKARVLSWLVGGVCGALLFCLPGWATPQAADSFPDIDPLLQRVVQNQKKVESLLNAYTFTDKQTIYMLDKKGQVRSQHTDTYYITPTPYEAFTIHVARDGKPVSEADLKKQQSEIEHKLREYEKKAEKPGAVHPKRILLFTDIVVNSRFTPLRWDQASGKRAVVYNFEPKTAPRRKGDLTTRIAEDLKGKMWIAPDDAEILRVEFANVSPLTFGYGFLGNTRSFEGYVDQRKVHDEVWLPTHEEFVAEGRQLIKKYRIRQVDELSDYLKATTDVFQQLRSPNAGAVDSTAGPR
jgi:hypothetical protein